ncbi:MAG: site-specific DNA-methyltransferase [Halobacteria archaeon]|nr:site-specific DNA-methyltransferase [Halobacteria archaeon]
METQHRIFVGDSRKMDRLEDGEVDLVVTSPPYPMIEMWDGTFSELNPEIGEALENKEGDTAFELMHRELDKVWDEVGRVLTPGGIACINIGDATRKVGGSFEMYPNHVRVIERFRENGFQILPDILWRKPTNSATKFMGSGMLPPNAYVTLEHEHILIFRNEGGKRIFEPGSQDRYESAYFWEERNDWFSDVWLDIKGALQKLDRDELRERSGAFPFELPYRLINMFSVYGDTVLDPFWGTGTTSLAAIVAARNSVGYEIEEEFTSVFSDRVEGVREMSRRINQERLDRHREFVEQRKENGMDPKYNAENYDFPVVTKQEKQIQLYSVEETERENVSYRVSHSKFKDIYQR